MFRNPRRSSLLDPLPSADRGRPPTPPQNVRKSPPRNRAEYTRAMAVPSTPVLGRSKTIPKTGTSSVTRFTNSLGTRANGKGNGNILNFFQKAAVQDTIKDNHQGYDLSQEGSLFLDDNDFGLGTGARVQGQMVTPPKEIHSPQSGNYAREPDEERHHEVGGAVKRRKLEDSDVNTFRKVPFFARMDAFDSIKETTREGVANPEAARSDLTKNIAIPSTPERTEAKISIGTDTRPQSPIPTLKHESTSYGEVNEFDDIEDFVDDEFPTDGEEYIERKWMEEQAAMEEGFEEDDEPGGVSDGIMQECEGDNDRSPPIGESPSCPLCGVALVGITDQEASKHVNDCLDGNPTRLPKPAVVNHGPPIKKEIGAPAHKRFQRAAIARPGQENPFGLVQAGEKSSSAFSTLMSGHAEDAAWATAAATEAASRGKPAYQRTCPFYKILPGFSICVDAFRYGAVEGCKAYFLSHFHSDHYIGLTSSWCHGPIYCSHVTANLVRQQLRVDPKWVFDLHFDQKLEVPETGGVEVTMIPANHCPGSSLFLYEKVVGKGPNPKIQRVLHCGDFRACTAHVQHPLLRPDVIDAVTGKKSAQQKLDVCYLDTTYLTPKYAFPSQEDVIKSCADMCVSLSKDFVDENDSWEQTKREKAGSGMVRFVRKGSEIKTEEDLPETNPAPAAESPTKRKRGRLLVIVGTYSIGKERICLGVAKALNSKIYAPPQKQRIVAALEDPDLNARMTTNPFEAQVHMQMLMEIRAETLADYLTGYKPHFSRIVGFRPSGWNYRPPNSRFTESPSVQTVLYSDNWKSRYTMADLVPQRGSTREANCFGVPYSEHSSFRELTMFCCALRIDKIIPTVNVGAAKSRERMKGWCEKWAAEKKKNGLFRVADAQTGW